MIQGLWENFTYKIGRPTSFPNVLGFLFGIFDFFLHTVKWLQVIELDLNQLPDGDEVLTILRQEQAPLHNWVMLAVSSVEKFTSSIFCYILPNYVAKWICDVPV